MSYTPNQSKYLTVAQSRTNNGQKDIRIILDIDTNIFYTLDDDNNFIPIAYSQTNPVDASGVTYDNSTSGLIATDVQDALDEISLKLPPDFKYWGGNEQTFLETQGAISSTAGALVFDVDVLFAYPVFIKDDVTIQEVSIAYSSSVAGNSIYGLYDMLNGAPNELIFETGAFDNAVTGVQLYTLPTPQPIKKGIYFVAYNTSSAPNVYAANGYNVLNVFGGSFSNINSNPNVRRTAGYTYNGTLPLTFGTATRTNGSYVPSVLFKL